MSLGWSSDDVLLNQHSVFLRRRMARQVCGSKAKETMLQNGMKLGNLLTLISYFVSAITSFSYSIGRNQRIDKHA